MKRHRLVPTAAPARGMNTTLIVPPRAPDAAPAPPPGQVCACGPITAVWIPYGDTVLSTAIPGPGDFYRYYVALGGVLPDGASWSYTDEWTATGSGEASAPYINFEGSGYAVWAAVQVNGAGPPGVLVITFVASCPNGEVVTASVTMIAGGGGYGSGSG